MADRRSWSQTHLDKIIFAGAALAGAGSIIAVDLADGSKWIAVGICVAVMLGYMGAALTAPGLKLRPDQAADNLYYLGLLYTLTSLGVALIQFASSEQATAAILRNFGIAIFTTIVGLGLRVFVSQFREDPEDYEAQAQAALTQSVHRMRTQLDLSVAELRSFADGMRQVIADFTDTAGAQATQALGRAVGQFEQATAAIGGRFEVSAHTFDARVQAFDTTLEQVVGALELMMTRIGAVRTDTDILERRLGPAAEVLEGAVMAYANSISQAGATFEAGARTADAVRRGVESLGQSSAALATASVQLHTVSIGLGRATELISRLDAAAGSAAQSTAAFSTRLAEIAAKADEKGARATSQAEAGLASIEVAARRVVDTLDRLDREFSGSGDTIATVRRELTELAGWMIARLERE